MRFSYYKLCQLNKKEDYFKLVWTVIWGMKTWVEMIPTRYMAKAITKNTVYQPINQEDSSEKHIIYIYIHTPLYSVAIIWNQIPNPYTTMSVGINSVMVLSLHIIFYTILK